MPNKEEKLNDPVAQLLAFSEAILQEDYSFRINMRADGSTLAKIAANLNTFIDRLQVSQMPDLEAAGSQLEEFIEVISSFANLDFSKKLKISDNSNVIDALATGINILGEELEYSTVSKEDLEKERDQLKIEKEKVEQASEAKTVFLGNLSHEIRTPLQGILGFSDILLARENSEERKKQIALIIKRARDLEEIIESLLDLATLESGEIKSNPEIVDIYKQVEMIYNEYSSDYSQKYTAIDFRFDNKLKPASLVLIDPLHLKQVILNLLNNSTKFTEKGSITLATECIDDNAVISVIDTGIGISKDRAELIFEPFRQAHEGLSRKAGGIGLGLPICKLRVNLWGGEIKVTSKEGEGSTFSFNVPLQRMI